MYMAPQIVTDNDIGNSVIKQAPKDTLGAIFTSDLSGVVEWNRRGIKAVCVPYEYEGFEYLIYPKNYEGLKTLAQLLNGVIALHDISNCSIVISNHNRNVNIEAIMKPHYYIGIMRPNGISLPNEEHFYKVANDTNVTVVGVHFSLYVKEDDELALYMLKRNKDQNFERKPKFKKILSHEEWNDFFGVELFNSTFEFLSNHQIEIKRGLSLPAPLSANKDLKEIILERNQNLTEVEITRVNQELEVIEELGFANVFKIVYDAIDFLRISNIKYGAGRGSAANSFISHLLGITEINPLEFNLNFERFLNTTRASLPDIDVDVDANEREKLIRYIKQEYGEDNVCLIRTHNNFGIRSAAQFTGKMFGFSEKKIKLSAFLLERDSVKLQEFVQSNELWYKAITSLIGVKRSNTIHNAGIIINKTPLRDEIFIDNDCTSLVKEELEQLNYVKFDFLSSPTLSFIKELENETSIKEADIPMHDTDTFNLISSGLTKGIFQLESDGMIKALKYIKPNSIEVLADVSSLHRPGPIKYIETYGTPSEAFTFSDGINDILKPTRGLIIYQEQLIYLIELFTQETLGECDNIRRKISKDYDFAKSFLKELFFKNDFPNKKIFFRMMHDMKDYSFPKGHALSYSIISYRLAYYKTHHTAAFLAVSFKLRKQTQALVEECKTLGIEVVPPTYQSMPMTTYVGNKVFVGWDAIKSVDSKKLYSLGEKIKEQHLDLPSILLFVSMEFQENEIEALVFSGFFSETVNHSSVQSYISYCNNILKKLDSLNFEDFKPPSIKEIRNEYNKVFLAEKQLEYLGFYVDENPIDSLKGDVYEAVNIEDINPGETSIVGKILKIKRTKTKKKEDMAFIDVFDKTGTLNCVIFNDSLKLFRNELIIDRYVLIRGICSMRNGKKQLTIKEAKCIN